MLVIYRDEGEQITITDEKTGNKITLTIKSFSHGIMNASVSEDFFYNTFDVEEGDDFRIGTEQENLTVRLAKVFDSKVKIVFDGPKTLKVWRTEIQERIDHENTRKGKTVRDL